MAAKKKNRRVSPFTALSEEEKLKLLRDYENGIPVVLPGMTAATLRRNIRRYRRDRPGGEVSIRATTGMREDTRSSKVSVSTPDPNHMVFQTTDARISTLEDLIKFCEIDLDVWEVERWVANTWEVGAKTEEKDLTFDQGVISGKVKSTGGIVVEPLIQIKAWLVRKIPVEITPVLRAVELTIPTSSYPKADFDDDVKTALILPDIHFGFYRDTRGRLIPFHDRAALALVLELARTFTAHYIIQLGDLLDLPDWSDKFLRSPEFTHTTQPALMEAAWWLAKLRELSPGAEFYVLEGNHEKRMETAVIKNVSAGYNVKSLDSNFSAWSIPNLLGLNNMGITWLGGYPDNTLWLKDDLRVEHGDNTGINVAAKVVQHSAASVVFGHIHRFEAATRIIQTEQGQQTVIGLSPGFLGKVDGSIPGAKKSSQWNQGIALIDFSDEDTAIMHIPISRGKAIFNGAVYTGHEEYLYRELKRDMGDEWGF